MASTSPRRTTRHMARTGSRSRLDSASEMIISPSSSQSSDRGAGSRRVWLGRKSVELESCRRAGEGEDDDAGAMGLLEPAVASIARANHVARARLLLGAMADDEPGPGERKARRRQVVARLTGLGASRPRNLIAGTVGNARSARSSSRDVMLFLHGYIASRRARNLKR